MPFPTAEVAGIAINQLTTGDIKVDPDRKQEAEYYADLAVEELKDSYDRDPATEKTTRAKQAAIQFVKTSLQGGDGSTDPRFQELAKQWLRSVYKDENRTDYQNSEEEYETRRINLYRNLDE